MQIIIKFNIIKHFQLNLLYLYWTITNDVKKLN